MPRSATASLVLATAIGILGTSLAGCGAVPPREGTVGSGVGGGTVSSATVTGLPPVVDSPTAPDTKQGASATVTGILSTASVEGSCLLLTVAADGGASAVDYLLVGDKATLVGLRSGAMVTVSGRPEAGLATTCQTGTPFLVDKVLPVSGSST